MDGGVGLDGINARFVKWKGGESTTRRSLKTVVVSSVVVSVASVVSFVSVVD